MRIFTIHRLPIILVALSLCCALTSCGSGAAGVGSQPALHATDVTGQPIDLANYRGKIVLVDFWATWCGPCMAEVPHMIRINNTYKDRGLAIIGISLDHSADIALQGARQHHLDWPQICDGGGWNSVFASQWGVDSIPRTFIISPAGRVLWQGHPAEIDQPLADAFRDHAAELSDTALPNRDYEPLPHSAPSVQFARADSPPNPQSP